jgi:hypothetical protein
VSLFANEQPPYRKLGRGAGRGKSRIARTIRSDKFLAEHGLPPNPRTVGNPLTLRQRLIKEKIEEKQFLKSCGVDDLE